MRTRSCKDYNPDQSDLIETGKYDSPDFTRGDGSFVSVSTGVFKTTAMAKTAYRRVAAPALAPLLRRAAREAEAEDDGRLGRPVRLPVRRRPVERLPPRRLDQVRDSRRSRHDRLRPLQPKGRTDVATIFFGLGKPLAPSLEQAAVAPRRSRAPDRHPERHLVRRKRPLSWVARASHRARLPFTDFEDDAEARYRAGRWPRRRRVGSSAALGAVADDAVPDRGGAATSARVSGSSARSSSGIASRSLMRRGRVRRRPLPLAPPERRGGAGAHQGREGRAAVPRRRAAAAGPCGDRARDRLRPPRERDRDHALPVGHGDARPRRPVQQDGLDDVVPARHERPDPLPGPADLRREDQLGLRDAAGAKGTRQTVSD